MKSYFRCFVTVCLAARVLFAQDSLIPAAQRRPAPPLSLTDMNGHSVQLASFTGQVLLLNFWATWCGGCKEEMPWFVDYYHQVHARGLSILGVSMDEDGPELVRSFLKSHPVPYPIAMGDDRLAARYALRGMPLTILIDRRGRLAGSHSGVVNRDQFHALINQLLQEGQSRTSK